MLSRTAENLYWLARYMERAETMARLLEVGYRMALMPSAGEGYRNEWASLVAAAGSAAGFEAKFGEEVRQRDVETWLFFDRENPSSVVSCIETARQNGRAVRTALTSEMWDALNGAYLELREIERRPRSAAHLPQLCDWTKRHGAQLRGATEGTHLQNDGFDFLNLGTYLERGDNTARLLDVKYYVLLPTTDMVGGSIDTYQWTTLLRALSAYRAFHWSYGGEYSPRKIAHFLILNRACPRSLLHCQEKVGEHLGRLAQAYGRRIIAHDRLGVMLGELAEARVQDIIDEGLHEFLTRFIYQNAALGQDVADGYLSGSTTMRLPTCA
ncbi:alpha-E domain-containing protein [Amaricoccus sp.]|uniref:alpha-E domain-containing protein n=1 Tax=Amaricoccus sp. TaxID=1872485 RepID=UPI00262A24AD|nr:alpha-E domain-containing protein [Amaricoccus sp.]HRO12649.1 alpha-E domain-containing protein [Amaricoccus sp.]